ncbi:HlyD family efflux transporter periplasmic adaptor subunit [Burkholderia cenocepacia]|uniref:HlyD family efflux transporter periplasmic adaptor subunit n=1 Tax=Burkholderia cenocepacia TaxID=95486 RepID=UPI000A064500|nr:HlyD family secretion protein [Burkholderia cenocepacia]MCW3678748.1 HlyD family secretion protein [Burkholderia cenocepacia]MDC6086532.1 HlyD family secretion protein [Burkholderia cenocepacia]
MNRQFAPIARWVFTSILVLASVLVVAWMWKRYESDPSTRDCRVSANIVRIAPEVSGTVSDVRVTDNQYVRRGEVLYVIAPERFRIAVDAAEANVAARKEEMVAYEKCACHQSPRLYAAAPENGLASEVAAAHAAWRQAEAALKLAELDLARATIRSPVDGYVTNVQLRPGDYATAGQTKLTVVEATGFWITGYFEETKLRQIRVGSPAQIRLMSAEQPIMGHVESIGRGIADENTIPNHLGLPNIEAAFNWVRLAQRIPVRIRIDRVPTGVDLVVGMSASVTVKIDAHQ